MILYKLANNFISNNQQSDLKTELLNSCLKDNGTTMKIQYPYLNDIEVKWETGNLKIVYPQTYNSNESHEINKDSISKLDIMKVYATCIKK